MSRARRMTGWGVGLGIVLALLSTLDTSGVMERLAGAQPALVVLGVAGLTCMHLLGAAAWRALARRLAGAEMPWRQAVRLSYAAQALGGLSPANLGGDVYRVWALRGHAGGWRPAALPVVVQRATSYLALGLLAVLALPILAVTGAVPADLTLAVVGLLAVAAAMVGLLLGLPRRLLARIQDRAATRGQLAAAAGIGLVLGGAFHLGSVVLAWILVIAVDPHAGTLAALAAIAVARLSLAIPFSPSGLGFQEGALVLLFLGLGLPTETALAGSLLARLSLVATTLIGAMFLAGAAAQGGSAITVSRRVSDPHG